MAVIKLILWSVYYNFNNNFTRDITAHNLCSCIAWSLWLWATEQPSLPSLTIKVICITGGGGNPYYLSDVLGDNKRQRRCCNYIGHQSLGVKTMRKPGKESWTTCLGHWFHFYYCHSGLFLHVHRHFTHLPNKGRKGRQKVCPRKTYRCKCVATST